MLVAAGIVAAAVVLAVVLLAGDDGDGEVVKTGVATEFSTSELRSFARSQPRAVYWAGVTPGFKFELTRTRTGNVFVRYLPEGVAAGDKRDTFTTVGSYPVNDAFRVASRAAKQRGAVRADAPGGGIVVARARSRSAYLAYPGATVLVEVYASEPGAARRLALSGRVGPIQ